MTDKLPKLACQREIMRHADDSAAYLSVKCTCGKCLTGAATSPQPTAERQYGEKEAEAKEESLSSLERRPKESGDCITVQSPTPTEGARVHELKTWPQFYEALESGAKTFEIRRDDIGFRVGDVLWLREWRPVKAPATIADGEYTGREMRRTVTYVLSNYIGLQTDYVCMGLRAAHGGQKDVFPAVEDALAKHCRGFMDRPTTRDNIAELVDKICDTYKREVQHRQELQRQLEAAHGGQEEKV